MDKNLKLAVSPHIHSGRSTAGIMRDVLIALLPAAVAGIGTWDLVDTGMTNVFAWMRTA